MEISKSLESAYRLHGPRILAYLQSRIADRHDCEELLQEVFMIVAHEPDALICADSPFAWLIGIARNLVREHGRRHKSVSAEAVDTLPARQEGLPEELSAMRQAINGLPQAQREVLGLRLREQLSYAQIAALLEIPIGTVRSRIHHAVKSLRDSLECVPVAAMRNERADHG